MRPSRILEKIRRDEPALITSCTLTDSSILELTSMIGIDGIWLDMEHHACSVETASVMMRAARVGVSDIVVRPAKWEYMRMGRMLEMGASGIIYPRCSSAEEAAEVVKWAKFAPLGQRGCDGGNPDMPYGTMKLDEYIEQANRETFVIIQIEEESAIDQADEIVAVDGVDGLLLGPGDFSVLSGIPGQVNHPKVLKAKEKLANAALSAGKHWMVICPSAEQAKEAIDMGARLICCMADILFIKHGLERMRDEFNEIGFSIEGPLSKPAQS